MLRRLLDRQAQRFERGPLRHLQPLFEAFDAFLYTPGSVTAGASHVRDGLDLKRMMTVVVVSLAGTVAMAIYNTGLQAHIAVAAGAPPLDTWQTTAMQALGLSFDPGNALACAVHGALYFAPVTLVCYATGGFWETLFASVRRHEINEGFFVTGLLIPLILPPAIPLWQVALGTSFGVVIGKEIFGGTGMNLLNPALTARAFLFFAYPAQLSGNVWTAAGLPDAVSSATPLAAATTAGAAAFAGLAWWDAFLGVVPGSMGETSALACLAGAALLVLTGIGSWRIMLGVTLGTIAAASGLNAIGSATNPYFDVPFWWHMVLGGWAFGTAYMATDPVTACQTDTGRWAYGILIGVLVVLIRVVNPAYPEGMMLAILLMNVFAPAIDHAIVHANIRRRQRRVVTG